MSNPKLDHALAYIELGWYVFPCWWVEADGSCACKSPTCTSKGKHPIGAAAQRGVWDASNDPKMIRHWWRQYPQANIAAHCGPSGFIAIDLDSYKKVYEPEAVEKLLTEADLDTVINATPSPGRHVLYRNATRYGNHKKLFPPGIDIRSWGAYIMVPLSNHVDGVYAWIRDPFENDMAEIPPAVRELLDRMEAQIREAKERKVERTFEALPELAKVAEALSFIPNWSINEREGGLEYRDWLAVLMAIHSAYPGEEGIDLCEAWSPGFPGEIEAKFKSFQGTGYTMATVAHMARSHGWAGRFDHDWRAGFGPDHMGLELDQAGDTKIARVHSSWPYLIRDGRLVFLKPAKDDEIDRIPIADFSATITETVIDEYGDQIFVIEGEGIRGGPFRVEVPAVEYGNSARLKAYLDGVSARDGVHHRMSEHLGPAIKKLTTSEATRRRFHRLGWHKGKFLIPGREAAGVEIVLSEKAQRGYNLGTVTDPGLAVEALQRLIQGIGPNGTLFVAFVLAPPLAGLAGLHSMKYGLFARGITGSMKTTCSQLTMSLWGPNFAIEQLYEKVGEHGATTQGIMGRVAEAADMPIMIDNFKPNTQGKESVVSLIHGIMEGYTKSRSTRSGTNARSYALTAWPLMTGEDVPGSDTAALARLIICDMESREGTEQPDITRVQQIAQHLSAIGAAWLDLLESPAGARVVQLFQSTYEDYRRLFAEHIRTHSPKAENILRSASNFALNYATWVALQELPLIAGIVDQYHAQHMDQLFALAGDIGKHTAESLEANRFLNILHELIVSGRVHIRPIGEAVPPMGLNTVGWYTETTICFYPTLVRKAVEDIDKNALNGISSTALYKQLAQLGALLPGEQSTQTKNDPATGKSTKALVLRLSAFGEDEIKPARVLAREIGL